ncbi:TetR/AcrR family transcriptional regulator [Halobacterium salinarum]|uniref:TetR/AcrR family transcriptional regulator n=1 Tax=Halobacterium salinarum TaxID=2242 RepID=UPI00298CD32E|nr:TetR/AcrR family transcriptional regulator [Halobacterium salinarum]WJK64809.1 TetR/AcrR family transcriptional regulator [Halobacterium salinarum]
MPDNQSDQDDSKGELLEATGTAIAEHGVSNVTTQKIADEWGRSQSLIHYYYETKTDLIVAYVDDLHDKIATEHANHAADPPLARVERAVVPGIIDNEGRSMALALFNLHEEALYNDRYQDALNDLEDQARDFLETAIKDGIESGTFRDVSPTEVATLLLSAHDGGILRTVTLGRHADSEHLNLGIERYVARVLLTEDARSEWDGFDPESH